MSDENIREDAELIAPENKLWYPPSSPGGQKRLDHFQKGKLPKWTGFSHKTLWDWLQLLIVPVILAVGATWFNFTQTQVSLQNSQRQHDTDTQISLDHQREEALVTYEKDISDLLLTYQLRSSGDGSEVRSVARARTLSTLQTLDSNRKGFLIQFLSEAGLIKSRVISLRGANLFKANLWGDNLWEADLKNADLWEADLSAANLRGAYLFGAYLRGTNFWEADLRGANLIGANLRGAYFWGADLWGANLKDAINTTTEQLEKATSLKDAIMPDGSKHP